MVVEVFYHIIFLIKIGMILPIVVRYAVDLILLM